METEQIELAYKEKGSNIEHYVGAIENILYDCMVPVEGNSFYHHETLNRYHALRPKQKNLLWAGTKATVKLCEIGFNAGHSAVLMLLGAPTTLEKFLVFDIGEHAYMAPTLAYVRSQFPKVVIESSIGDSKVTMPAWIEAHPEQKETFDVVHVDGGHDIATVTEDVKNSDRLLRVGGLMILDDTNNPMIGATAYGLVNSGRYKIEPILKTNGYEHMILSKVASASE